MTTNGIRIPVAKWLPAPLLTCLRILEREHENEQRYIDAEALK